MMLLGFFGIELGVHGHRSNSRLQTASASCWLSEDRQKSSPTPPEFGGHLSMPTALIQQNNGLSRGLPYY